MCVVFVHFGLGKEYVKDKPHSGWQSTHMMWKTIKCWQRLPTLVLSNLDQNLMLYRLLAFCHTVISAFCSNEQHWISRLVQSSPENYFKDAYAYTHM